jgi:hypothetical protein
MVFEFIALRSVSDEVKDKRPDSGASEGCNMIEEVK